MLLYVKQNILYTHYRNEKLMVFFRFWLFLENCIIYQWYYLLHIAIRLPIDCLSIALDAHMLSHNRYGPGTRAAWLQQKAASDCSRRLHRGSKMTCFIRETTYSNMKFDIIDFNKSLFEYLFIIGPFLY